jgi:type VI secretion system protein ImpH
MAATDGPAPDPVALFRSLAATPWAYDLFQALRRIECLYARQPRFGRALRPRDEPVRVGQEASVAFATSTVSALEMDGTRPPRLEQRAFGLLGPNGPLPLHLTEYVRDRLLHHDDPTLARFLDILHHRWTLLFYRAWADAQPTVQHDRPAEDRFATYVSTFAGLGAPALQDRDSVPDDAKRFLVGRLGPAVKNADGLAAILSEYFSVPVRVEEFVPSWLELPPDQRTALGGAPREAGRLGEGTVLGTRVCDAQSTFRIVVGPVNAERYERFLPGGPSLQRLGDWVRNYVGFEFDWQVQVLLERDEVPAVRLGREGRLGRTAWLGIRRSERDADDLLMAPERDLAAGKAA